MARRVHCRFCGQTYYTGPGDRCSLCRQLGGLVEVTPTRSTPATAIRPGPPPAVAPEGGAVPPHGAPRREAFSQGLPIARLLADPLVPLALFALVASLGLYVSMSARAAPGPGVELVLGFGWACMLALWMDADARQRRRVPCFEFAFLAALTLPISVVWYCLWSRGWSGLVLLLAVAGLWLLPYVLAMLVWL